MQLLAIRVIVGSIQLDSDLNCLDSLAFTLNILLTPFSLACSFFSRILSTSPDLQHSRNETRRRARIRDQFDSLKSAIECDKKDRYNILQFAVECVKGYQVSVTSRATACIDLEDIASDWSSYRYRSLSLSLSVLSHSLRLVSLLSSRRSLSMSLVLNSDSMRRR